MIRLVAICIDSLFVSYVRGPDHPCKLRIVEWLIRCWFRQITAETESGRMVLDTHDLIQRALLSYGHFEPATCRLHRKLLKPGDCFLDVGANVGTFSLLAAKLVGRLGQVVSVDANPFVFSRLLQNLALNHEFTSCVTPISVACSGENGIARLQLPDAANCGLGHLTNSTEQDTFVVCTRRLSSLLADIGIRQVTLMKIDVEGHEKPILEDIFANGIRPLHVIFEFLPEDFPEHLAVLELLKSNGYRVQSLDGEIYTDVHVEENNLWATLEAGKS